MPSVPYQIDDAKTDAVAASGKWRTLLPTDVTPALLADLGGAHQGGSFAIAANASPRRAAFNVATTPNTTVQGDRYFDVEIYDVLPAGTSLTVGKVRTKIVEDDTAAPSNIYGPTTTDDTEATRINAGPSVAPNGYKISGTLKQGYALHVMGFTDNGATGVGGYVMRGQANGGAASPTSMTGYYRDAAGVESLDNNAISLATPNVFAGVAFECEVSKTGAVKLTIGGTVVFNRTPFGAQTDLSSFSFVRVQTANTAGTITITALSA